MEADGSGLGGKLDDTLLGNSPDIHAWYHGFVKACADVGGDHGKYVNTPQTNSILDAVGQDYMVYWGTSYGTLLGQTYAGLFPHRSKRVIVDGVVNQFTWYSNSDHLDVEDMVFDPVVRENSGAGVSFIFQVHSPGFLQPERQSRCDLSMEIGTCLALFDKILRIYSLINRPRYSLTRSYASSTSSCTTLLLGAIQQGNDLG